MADLMEMYPDDSPVAYAIIRGFSLALNNSETPFIVSLTSAVYKDQALPPVASCKAVHPICTPGIGS